jgi:hypothetical protein
LGGPFSAGRISCCRLKKRPADKVTPHLLYLCSCLENYITLYFFIFGLCRVSRAETQSVYSNVSLPSTKKTQRFGSSKHGVADHHSIAHTSPDPPVLFRCSIALSAASTVATTVVVSLVSLVRSVIAPLFQPLDAFGSWIKQSKNGPSHTGSRMLHFCGWKGVRCFVKMTFISFCLDWVRGTFLSLKRSNPVGL